MMSKRWFLTLIMTGVVATLITVLGAWSSPTAAQASDQDDFVDGTSHETPRGRTGVENMERGMICYPARPPAVTPSFFSRCRARSASRELG